MFCVGDVDCFTCLFPHLLGQRFTIVTGVSGMVETILVVGIQIGDYYFLF